VLVIKDFIGGKATMKRPVHLQWAIWLIGTYIISISRHSKRSIAFPPIPSHHLRAHHPILPILAENYYDKKSNERRDNFIQVVDVHQGSLLDN
jgi:hypothetical protein